MPIAAIRRVVAAAAVAACLWPAPSFSAAQHAGVLQRPVLAFYYTWYHPSTFCTCTMSDLPVRPYESSDVATMDRQIRQAANAGITGFITSWPGPGNTQDANLGTLLSRISAYRQRTGHSFVSSVYIESDADAVRGNLVGALRYAIAHYVWNPNFFRWHGKPVIFVWDPLGGGRTLATWARVRQEVDPSHRLLWSAEGTDLSLLQVFDGIHLFSAADWGLQDGSIGSVDAGFRSRIDGYNRAHGTAKIWAAGVEPGYNDTRVPGRAHPHVVPRRNGATYRESWRAAVASRPQWVTISTWNEWFEGAMIEPSRTYRKLYLTLTEQLAGQWRRS